MSEGFGAEDPPPPPQLCSERQRPLILGGSGSAHMVLSVILGGSDQPMLFRCSLLLSLWFQSVRDERKRRRGQCD